MRILWVSANGGNYKSYKVKGTGGWTGALQEALCSALPDLELGITFFHSTDDDNIEENGVTYMPVSYDYGKTEVQKLLIRHFRNEDKYRSNRLRAMVEKIRIYKPDVIHIWGIEHFHAGVLEYINDIPIVVHIQGLLSACMYTYMPPSLSLETLKHSDTWISRNLLKNGFWFYYELNKKRAENEIHCSKFIKNWIGRTDWDYAMSQMLSPGSRYFHCEELMRSDFDGYKWHYHYDGEVINIHSSISGEWYKGIDIVLKTAQLLKNLNVNICWNVYGCSRRSKLVLTYAKLFNINPDDVNVYLHGQVDGETIKQGLLLCDCYVHPSYIENSSNAIAEAQMLGVPVIAQYVGGNASMLRDGSGILVAPNEPYILASAIMKMRDKSIAEDLSVKAFNIGQHRQNKEKTIKDLVSIYQQLLYAEEK